MKINKHNKEESKMKKVKFKSASALMVLLLASCFIAYGCDGDNGGTTCPAGQTLCSGSCVDTNTSTSHCGSCGTACPLGADCVGGTCQCTGGDTLCGTQCVDTQTDGNHCGGCNHACGTGTPCVNGVCGCPAGETDCGGTCVDTQTSNQHCGSCNNACPAAASCVGGVCQCPTGQTLCGEECVDTQTNASHCGGCDNQCAEVQSCVGGSCQCPTGQVLCGDDCVDTQTDKQHCGGCDQACASAQSCVGGECECPDGKTLCGEECVDTQTDSRHCGTCNHPCGDGEACVSGSCESTASCADVPDDSYEANDSCAQARSLPDAPEGAGMVTVGDAILSHPDGTLDQDWYTVYADEASHICWPGDPQCTFYYDISLTLPSTVDHTNYELCVMVGDCPTFDSTFCTEESDWNDTTDTYTMSLMWLGTCGLDDAWTFYVKISKETDDENCDQYTLSYEFDFISEECPE